MTEETKIAEMTFIELPRKDSKVAQAFGCPPVVLGNSLAPHELKFCYVHQLHQLVIYWQDETSNHDSARRFGEGGGYLPQGAGKPAGAYLCGAGRSPRVPTGTGISASSSASQTHTRWPQWSERRERRARRVPSRH